MEFYEEHPQNWRDCFAYIHANYGYDKYPGNCHIIPNIAVMILALLYGNGDFQIPSPSLQCVDGIPIVTVVMWQPLLVSAMVWRALIMTAGENLCMTCWSAPV